MVNREIVDGRGVVPVPFRIDGEALHLDLSPLTAGIASKSTLGPKKPQILPRWESLNSKLVRLVPRQFAVVTGYCVYEKKKNREIKNPKQIKLKNGRPAIKGTCASCGKAIFRIGKLK